MQSDAEWDVVGIGVSVWDSVMLVEHFPEHGTVCRASQCIQGIGGGVTVAVATAAVLGARTTMLDALGDDSAGVQIVDALRGFGVDTTAMIIRRGETSSSASIWSDRATSERTIVFAPGSACDALEWTSEIDSRVSRSRIVHLNGRHPEVCRRAIERAREVGALVSFDGGAYRYRDEIVPILRASDLVIVAKQFAQSHFQAVTGKSPEVQLSQLCDFLMSDLRCRLVGVTDGAQGSAFLEAGHNTFHQPAIDPDKAVDTTGCGDTFHGAFLAEFVRGATIERAALTATEIASRNASSIGGLGFSRPAD